jgi:WhiB family transcriptional regulator, redox-sensing transcriptional regulator
LATDESSATVRFAMECAQTTAAASDFRPADPDTFPEAPLDLYAWCEVLEELPAPPAWQAEAACRHADPGTFFPEVADVHTLVAAAKRICAGCPVRERCLEEALATPDLAGIWGGTTHQERRAMRRRAA